MNVRSLVLLLAAASPAAAEVTFDGSLGDPGSLSGAMTIPADRGQLAGDNLFHSFGVFHVRAGESATFTGPANVTNVFSRVTGGDMSVIDGAIGTDMSGADFWFINPAGFMFGSGADLNLPAAVYFSSADQLEFGTELFVANSGDVTLSVASPTAFGFTDGTIGGITLDTARVEVAPGARLGLVGGDLLLDDSTAYASGGRIDLVAMSGPGSVALADLVAGGPSIDGADGSITLTPLRTFRLDGFRLLANVDVTGDDAGQVVIRGGDLSADFAFLFADTAAAGTGGGIDADLSGNLTLLNGARITADTLAGSSGSGGALDLRVGGTLRVAGRSRIATDAKGPANGGRLVIRAGQLTVEDEGAIQTNASSTGNAGTIDLGADNMTLQSGGRVSAETAGQGNGGQLLVTVSGELLATGVQDSTASGLAANTLSAGDAGDIVITAGSLRLEDGATLEAFTAPGASGAPGSITVNGESVSVRSGAQVDARSFSAADAGAIAFDVGALSVDGGSITASTFGTGNGGGIAITADSVTVPQGTVAVTTEGEGDAGAITVTAGNATFGGMAAVTSTANGAGAGAAGSIIVNAVTLSVDGATVSATTASDRADNAAADVRLAGTTSADFTAGNVSVSTTAAAPAGDVALSGGALGFTGSSVAAETSAAGNGGSVLVTGSSVSATSSTLSTSTTGSGNAGQVTLAADGAVSLAGDSALTSTSSGGNAGSAGSVMLTGGDLTVTASQLSATTDSSRTDTTPGSVSASASGDLVADGATFSVATSGAAAAGSVALSGSAVELTGSTLSAATTAAGAAGDVAVTAGGALAASGGTDISVASLGAGSGGAGTLALAADALTIGDSSISAVTEANDTSTAPSDINLTATGTLLLDAGADVSAETRGAAAAGSVRLAGTALTLDGARLSASTSAAGNGGSVTVDGTSVGATDSALSTSTTGAGDAGQVALVLTGAVSLAGDSALTSTSSGGNAGSAGSISVSGDGVTLAGSTLSATTDSARTDTTPGSVDVTALGILGADGATLSVATSGAAAAGSVTLSGAAVQLSGSTVSAATTASGAAGDVAISGGSIGVSAGSVSASTTAAGRAGGVTITASDELTTSAAAEVSVASLGAASGGAGSLALEGAAVSIGDSTISAITESNNTATSPSDVSVTSNGGLDLAGSVSAATRRAATAGSVTLIGTSVNITGTASASTSAAGNGGTVTVAGDSVALAGGQVTTSTTGTGNAGAISISGPSGVDLSGGATVDSASLAAGAGAGGSISINGGALTLADASNISVRTLSASNAGTISVLASALNMASAAAIDSSTLGGGAGGSVTLDISNAVVLAGNGTRVASSSGDGSDGAFGAGGDVRVQGATVDLSSGAEISSAASGDGFAGSVAVVGERTLTITNAAVRTSSLNSGGGNIEVMVVEQILLDNAAISASAGGDMVGDDGGNVSIDPIFLILFNSSITARANVGDGGIILLVADTFLKDATSVLDASSDLGNDGEVRIESPDSDINASIVALSAALYEPDALVQNACQVALGAAPQSSFVVESQHRIRPAPEAYLAIGSGPAVPALAVLSLGGCSGSVGGR